ncbi:hypothetical protein V6U77_02810 [Micromonospora sp. CPCC 205546]|uniref:hypothetical protein n=1 Tax=Micromonospora sp. CPCC 205546 TaxID=3122397 RepID=UPI002FF04EB1
MTEAARRVVQQTEERLEEVAKNVREKFDRVTEGRLTDKNQNASAERADHGTDRGPDEARRRGQGGSGH